MSGTKTAVPGIKGQSTLVWPTFEAGMLLQSEDLDLLRSGPLELMRLLFRSFFGCGVVCGLVVRVSEKCGKICVTVGAGVGLDCGGGAIQVPTDQTFALDEDCDPNLKGPLWVVLCRTSKRCAQRAAVCGCDDDEPAMVSTRERDGFEIRVESSVKRCVCACDRKDYEPPDDDDEDSHCWCADPCDPCHQSHYAGECGCRCDDCGDCIGRCIVLARLSKEPGEEDGVWVADHSVRRFIRPVLMRDPRVALEQKKPGCKPPAEEEPKPEAPEEPELLIGAAQQKPAVKTPKATKSPKR